MLKFSGSSYLIGGHFEKGGRTATAAAVPAEAGTARTLTGQQHSCGSRWHNSGAERGARNTAAEQLRTQAPRRHTRVVQLPAQQPETALGRTRLRSQGAQDRRRPSLTWSRKPNSKTRNPPTGLFSDTPTSMLLGIPKGARCVQSFDDSLDSASRKTYRI